MMMGSGIKVGVMEGFQSSKDWVREEKWTDEEEGRLWTAVKRLGVGHWGDVAQILERHSPGQCHRRWIHLTTHPSHERPWTATEDQLLSTWVNVKGAVDWSACASMLESRSPQQCRRRWITQLSTASSWTPQEDQLLLAQFSQFGPNWSQISLAFSGSHSEADIRNRHLSLTQASTPVGAEDPSDGDCMSREEAQRQVTLLLQHMRGLEALLVEAKSQAKSLESSIKEDEKVKEER